MASVQALRSISGYRQPVQAEHNTPGLLSSIKGWLSGRKAAKEAKATEERRILAEHAAAAARIKNTRPLQSGANARS